MTEEHLTREVLAWLKERGWHVLSFDYPHSGTGYALRPSSDGLLSKNQGVLIPDIIANKCGITVVFENKVDYFCGDIEALRLVRDTNLFEDSLRRLHGLFEMSVLLIGVALSRKPKNVKRLAANETTLDLALTVDESNRVSVLYDSHSIFNSE